MVNKPLGRPYFWHGGLTSHKDCMPSYHHSGNRNRMSILQLNSTHQLTGQVKGSSLSGYSKSDEATLLHTTVVAGGISTD